MGPKRALWLIGKGTQAELVAWASKNLDPRDTHILDDLTRGYQTTFKGGYDYRGALVHTYRQIAARALQSEEPKDG